MKKILLLLIIEILFTSIAFAQNYPIPFKFETVDSAQGTKSELFIKANEWLAKTFNSAKDVIQMSDKDAGKIIAKGIMETYTKVGITKGVYYTKFTLTIDVMDNKCRIRIFDFITQECKTNNGHLMSINYSLDNSEPPSNGLGSYGKKMWEDIKNYCFTQSNQLAEDLLVALKTKSENW